MNTQVIRHALVWMAAPALVLALIFWCYLHGIALGVEPVGLDISAPWALKSAIGWILAGALLARFGKRLLASPFAVRRPWTTRSLIGAGMVCVTLTCETWLLADDSGVKHWVYDHLPVHATAAALLLGSYLLMRTQPPARCEPAAMPDAPTMLDVLTGTGRTQVPLDEVECLEADRNYINVHTEQRSYLVRQTLSSFEQSLRSQDFLRIHRSIIVNRAKIRERRRGGILVLRSGRTVRVSRAFSDRLN